MATQLQIRRGTTSQMNAFTGAEGELAVNTTTDTVHVHDGSTAGGHALAKADGSNIGTYAGSFTTIAASGTITGDVTGDLTGSVLTAAQTNITSVGTLSSLAVTGALTANGGIDVTGLATASEMTVSDTDDIRLRFLNGTTFKAGIQVATSTGDMIAGSAVDDLAIRSQANMLFSAGGNTEAMRIDASGNLQLGTGTPAYLVGTGDIAQLSVNRVGTSGVITNTSRSAAFINVNGANGGSSIEFSTASANNTQPTERMRIDSSGNVGIGTSSPSTKLHLGGTAPLDSIIRQDSTVSGTNWEIGEREAGKWQIFEDDSDSVVATFTSSGNVGIGTSSPSAKLQISQNSNGAYVTSSIVNTNAGGYSNLTLTAGSATSGIYYAPGIFFAVGPASGDTTTPIVFRNNNATERMRIDSNGVLQSNGYSVVASSARTASGTLRLGNIPSTSMLLDYDDQGQTTATVRNQYGTTAGGAELSLDSGFITFNTGTSFTERMRIDSAGVLLHGTSTQLVNGWANHKFNGTVYNGLNLQTTRTALNSTFQVFLNSAGATCGTILHNGTTTVNYGTSSDQRLKENISDSGDSGSTIDAIQVREFDWIDGGAHEKYGFIAQELNNVVPNAVSGTGLPDDEDPMLCVDPSKLVALAIKEIQMLRARVAELENT